MLKKFFWIFLFFYSFLDAKEVIFITSKKEINSSKKIKFIFEDPKKKDKDLSQKKIKKNSKELAKDLNISSKTLEKNQTLKTPKEGIKKTFYSKTLAEVLKEKDLPKKEPLEKEQNQTKNLDQNKSFVFKNDKKASRISSKKKIDKKSDQNHQALSKKTSRKIKKVKRRFKKAILVIIIDDISSLRQIKKIKSLPFKVTPSIFPPSNMSETTPRLIKNLNGHYMIHLPLQSHSAKMNRFRKTLMIYDSKRKIQNRVKEIRRLFPKAIFINNHTGSTFTSNYHASKTLLKELIKYNFIFVDSKTTGKSKIKRVLKEFGKVYIGRDFFLDNTQSVSYILRQLKRAVKLAKKRGYAIVIGHPHPSTFQALREAKYILKDIQTLYIDEFYQKISKNTPSKL